MDIIVKGVLDFVQSLPGHENTVIAGGAIRDSFFNLEPNDYDFCVPSRNHKDMAELAYKVGEQYGTPVYCKTGTVYDEGNNGQKLTTVWNTTIEGRKIDLIGTREENDEDFGDLIVQSFDFGINMVYYNGVQVVEDNQFFREDKDYGQMTLVNLSAMHKLPNAIRRYENFCNRLGAPLSFRSTCLSLPEAKKKSKTAMYAALYGGSAGSEIDLPPPPFPTAADTITNLGWGSISNTPSTTQAQGQAGAQMATFQPIFE